LRGVPSVVKTKFHRTTILGWIGRIGSVWHRHGRDNEEDDLPDGGD
jgi:hypothetical protein